MSLFRQSKAIELLEDRCKALEATVSDLQIANRKLGLEWEELYDKVRRQMSRMSKRVAVDAKDEVEPLNDEAPTPSEPETDTISASILRRRGMRHQL